MAASKLDYLQKYLSGDNKEKKRRKKETSGSKKSTVRIIDDDIGFDQLTPAAGDADAAWDLKDDAPVVVAEIDETKPRRVGSWNVVEPEKTRSSPSPSPPRRGRGRHDSDNDDDDDEPSPPRRGRHDSDDDASPPRRARHDSDGDASPPRRRHDDASPPRRARHDSDGDASPPRKRQSEAPHQDASPPRRRRDSDGDASPPRRRRDSDGDASPARRRKQPDESTGERKKQQFTSSGHAAGLQSGSTFGERERQIREQELANAPKLEGQSATVYRDKSGRKVDMLNEYMRQEAIREGREVQLKEQEFEWGRGAVQKEEVIKRREEFEEIKAEPFARTVDDPKLEAMRKQAIRDGDPMAAYFQQQQGGGGRGVGGRTKPAKPIYKGPPPPPNRFGIRPGYRWDGIDRGSGWEQRVLSRGSEMMAKEEAAYRWRSADL